MTLNDKTDLYSLDLSELTEFVKSIGEPAFRAKQIAAWLPLGTPISEMSNLSKALREKQHPAKRTFQAIRIAVNDELASVDRMLRGAVPKLNKGGRLAVITFHSLEDRIVKSGMADFAKGCTCPSDFPVCVCGKTPDVKLVSRKPILPTDEEIEENPRARSAKLRVCEKLKDPN